MLKIFSIASMQNTKHEQNYMSSDKEQLFKKRWNVSNNVKMKMSMSTYCSITTLGICNETLDQNCFQIMNTLVNYFLFIFWKLFQPPCLYSLTPRSILLVKISGRKARL